MKYFIFFAMLGFGVPLAIAGAALFARVRSWLVTALIATSCLDITTSINFLSLQFYRGTARGFEVTLTDLLTWSLIGALLIRFPRRVRYVPYNSVWMALSFVLAWLSFSLVDEPIYTGFALWKLVRLYLVYWCIYNCLRTGVPLVAVWRGIAIVAVLAIAYSFKQKYLDGLYRVKGTLHHPNSLSSYLLPVMPFLAFWGFTRSRPTSWRALLSIALSLGIALVVVVSQSRVGLLLMLANVPAVLLLANRWRRVVSTRIISGLLVLAILLAALRGADTVWDRFTNAPWASGAARVELNHTAFLMTFDHPWLGIGLNQYSRVASENPAYLAHLVVMANEDRQGVCHHMYWLTAAEMGVLGLLVYLVIIGRFWWLSTRHAWRRRDPESLLLASYMLGMGAVHLQALYEFVLRQTSVAYMFMIMSGVCVFLAQRVRSRTASARRAARIERVRATESVESSATAGTSGADS